MNTQRRSSPVAIVDDDESVQIALQDQMEAVKMGTQPRSRSVAIVDDDESVQIALQDLMEAVGLSARCFGSAEEFLNSGQQHRVGCLISDIRMPGMSGIELHRHLVASNCKLPVIFMTAHGYDDRARSAVSPDWAVAYLTKPFGEGELLDAVWAALKLKSSTEADR
jgi:FixJ family two-component response regulator